MAHLKLFCAPDDREAQALAATLVQTTDAEIVQSPGIQPTLWMAGRVYYGLARVQAALDEAGTTQREPPGTEL